MLLIVQTAGRKKITAETCFFVFKTDQVFIIILNGSRIIQYD